MITAPLSIPPTRIHIKQSGSITTNDMANACLMVLKFAAMLSAEDIGIATALAAIMGPPIRDIAPTHIRPSGFMPRIPAAIQARAAGKKGIQIGMDKNDLSEIAAQATPSVIAPISPYVNTR